MGDKTEEKKPDGDLLLTLQNRLNNLEIKSAEAEKVNSGKSYAEKKDLEDKIAALEARIKETFLEKPKPETKKDDSNGNNGKDNAPKRSEWDPSGILGI